MKQIILFLLLCLPQVSQAQSKPNNSAIHTYEKTKDSQQAAQNIIPALTCSVQSVSTDSNAAKAQDQEANRDIAKYTLWLAIGTVLLAVFSFWQVFVSRRTAKRQLRAYLYVTNEGEAPEGFGARFIIKNSGQTPAHVISYWIISEVRNSKSTSHFFDVPKSQVFTPTVLHTNGTPIGMLIKTVATAIEIERIKNGEAIVFFWGEVKYKDVFKKEWYCKFRFRSGSQGNHLGIEICPEGNEAN